MSGKKKLLLDTNAVLYILSNKQNREILRGNHLYISFVTELELLSFPAINDEEKEIINQFIKNTEIIDIDIIIKEKTIELRKRYRLKLPDAIICATALLQKCILVTNDTKLINIKEIKSVTLKIE
jgi:predicted nucleic acid-binding protein